VETCTIIPLQLLQQPCRFQGVGRLGSSCGCVRLHILHAYLKERLQPCLVLSSCADACAVDANCIFSNPTLSPITRGMCSITNMPPLCGCSHFIGRSQAMLGADNSAYSFRRNVCSCFPLPCSTARQKQQSPMWSLRGSQATYAWSCTPL
jgi:hypothetical protein